MKRHSFPQSFPFTRFPLSIHPGNTEFVSSLFQLQLTVVVVKLEDELEATIAGEFEEDSVTVVI